MTKHQKIYNTKTEEVHPIINSARDISFGSLGYMESIVEALLAAKLENGKAWENVSKLLEVSATAEGYVQLTLKVHGINTDLLTAETDFDEFHKREAELKARRHNLDTAVKLSKSLKSNDNSASKPDFVKFAFKG